MKKHMQLQQLTLKVGRSPLTALGVALALVASPGASRADEGPTEQPSATTPAAAEDTVVAAPEVAPTDPTLEAPVAPDPTYAPPLVEGLPSATPTPSKPLGIEISFGPEAQGLAASRMGRISGTDTQSSISFRVSYAVKAQLAVYAGWRAMPPFTFSNSTYSADSSAYGGVIGARWSEPLTAWLSAAFEIDLELLYGGTTLNINGLSGEDGSPAFGAVPKVGLGATAPLSETVAFEFRVMFGYALRTSHSVDRLVLATNHAGDTQALNLGSINFSGPMFALSLGLSF